MVFKLCVSKCFQNSTQVSMVFNCVFQSVFKIPCRLQWFSNNVFQSVFRSPHWFQWFSNNVFQSVFKIPPQVSKCFQIMCFKVFSKFPTDFSVFKWCAYKCFQNVFQSVLQKSHNSFNGFQMMCFKVFPNSHRFQWFSNCFQNSPQVSMVFNCVFQSVSKIMYRFQSVQMMCLKVFLKCVSKCSKFPTSFNGF